MKKKFIVIAIQVGKSGFGENKLFMYNSNGEVLKVNRGFALANGVDENFRGLLLYSSEFCKKGAKYTDADGVEQAYAEDFTKVTTLIPAAGSEYAKTLEREMAKKELYAQAEEL